MQGFEENNCRVCIKSFCCRKCRQKHESKVHNVVYSGCDICVYGKTFHCNQDKVLLQHIKEFHLPLHCVYCYQLFYNVEEIPQGRCSVAHFLIHKEDSPKTPLFRPPPPVLVTANDQNSPILQNLILKEGFNHLSLATSTPMQKAEENAIMFEKCNEEPLTPVDNNCAKSQIRCKSIIKNANSIMKQDSSSKRRVTFGEPSESNTNKSIIDSEHKKDSPNKDTQVTNTDGANYNSPFTPVAGANRSSMCSNQFYSAKSEITQSGNEARLLSKNRDKENLQQEDFTPVCALNIPKTSNNGRVHKLPGQNDVPAEEASSGKYDTTAELPERETPVKINPSLSLDAPKQLELNKEKSEEKLGDSTSLVMLLDTPANPAEKCSPEEPSSLPETELVKSDGSSSSATNDATACKTVWLSAMNPDNLELSERKLNTPMKNEPSENRRANVVVMPTPILKKTDIKMKFHVPAHFSSTPIMSMGSVRLRQTKIVEEVTTRVINQQTPYKTPQGKLFSLTKACTSLNNEAAESCHKRLLPLSEKNNENDNTSPNTEITLLEFKGRNEDFSDSSIKCASVSSMTESNLWTSMTRIVKSVFDSFSNKSNAEMMSTAKSPTSFKRHLSGSDSEDNLEVPRLKRFKFTDIKSRKPIRSEYALEVPTKVIAPSKSLASVEIFKSVSTLYKGAKLKIQCDKATQTDDYLMYGWRPQ
ncbi:uncharacterized protein fs(1)Ya isoform X2 [Euwallacea fornicatus]|uniref:uncharacterized protein fs(1)Ya isoform X2 n=1 Tax=Euwallacea fornicatus TaxID=995702 RepID=UPI00338E5504